MSKHYAKLTGAAALVLVAGLAGCTGTKDPGQAGFLDGLRNQTDGTYDRTIAAKRQERSGLERANALLEEDVTALEAEQQAGARKLARARSQLSQLRNRVAALRASYEVDRARYQSELATLDQVERDLSVQDARLTSASASNPSGGAAVENQADASLSEMQRLANIVNSMSVPG